MDPVMVDQRSNLVDDMNRRLYRDNGSSFKNPMAWNYAGAGFPLTITTTGTDLLDLEAVLVVRTTGIDIDVPLTISSDLLVTGNIAWKSGTAFKMILDHAATADRTVVFPNASDTVAELGQTQTFTGQNTYSNGTAPIITAKIGPSSTQQHAIPAVTSDTLALLATNQTFTGQNTFSNASAPIITAKLGPSSTQQHTLPVATSDTVALVAFAQTLTNKTLTAPTINGGALSGTFSGDHTLSGVLTLSAQPRARVFNSAAISHTTSSTWQSLTFDTERYDVGGLHAASAATFVATSTGSYMIGGCIAFAGSALGTSRGIRILLNGTTPLVHQFLGPQTATGTIFSVATAYDLTAGDTVELQGWQDTGGAINMSSSANSAPEFWIHRYA